MNHEWNLPAQESMTFVDSMRRQTEVLLAYDGPVLVTLTDEANQFLGMAVDEDDSGDFVRWLQVQVSDLELEAIKLGAEPLRWAFQKERVTVVDYDRRRRIPVRMWDIPIESVPEEALPEPDALFPGSRKQRAQAPVERPMFHLAGKTSPNRVTFGELSAIASRIQSLWGAFAQSFNAALAPLAVTAFERGSLKVIVHTDNPALFSRIGEEYKKLVLASDDRAKLEAAIAPLDPRVASTYRDYLRTLTLHQVEVLAEWREEAAFVSYATAARARQNPAAGVVPQTPARKKEVARRLRGVFQGFLRAKGFEFYDLDGDKWYAGSVAKGLREGLPPEFDMTLGRGLPKRYLVDIEIMRRGARETHRLLSYQEAPNTPADR